MRISFLVGMECLAMLSARPVAAEGRCDELLKQASLELRREQYPTMLSVAEERQRQCPGAESAFLVGLAKANMIDKLLVSEDESVLVRAQATEAFNAALSGELRPEWRDTATAWHEYLDQLPEPEPEPEAATSKQSLHIDPGSRRAAPPFEPTPFPWGPVIFGSVGVAMLGTAFVTGLMGHSANAELERGVRALCYPGRAPCRLHGLSPEMHLQLSRQQDEVRTLYTATNVLLVAGGASLVTAIVWWALSPDPDEAEDLSWMPDVRPGEVSGHVRVRF